MSANNSLNLLEVPLSDLMVESTGRDHMIRLLKTSVEYVTSDAIYGDPQIYSDFIGDEVEISAAKGRQIALQLRKKNPRVFLETCSGPGTLVRDIYKDYPGCAFIAADVANAMVDEGRWINPHLAFVQADVTDRALTSQVSIEANRMLGYPANRDTTVDVAFNSASSLGFMDIDQLDRHLSIMHDLLNPEGGQYFASIGYYSSVGASWINSTFLTKGCFKGNPCWGWHVTTQYFPLTDIHEIGWSAWSTDDPSRLLFAASHKLRASRASELAYMARNHGMNFRLWTHYGRDTVTGYRFEEVGPNLSIQFVQEVGYLCEFYRSNAPRLDQSPFTGFPIEAKSAT